MGNRIHSLTLATKSTAGKLALGAASFMVLTVIGSATIAGATPVTGTTKASDATSLQKQSEQDNNKDHLKNGNNGNKDHNKNKGDHGYGGSNNAVTTNITANQSGHDNVFTVIFNYIFG